MLCPGQKSKYKLLILLRLLSNIASVYRRIGELDQSWLEKPPPPQSKLEVDCNVTVVKSYGSIVNHMLSNLNSELKIREFYLPVPVREFLPSFDRRRVHELIDRLMREGLAMKCVHYVYHIGGNSQSLHFIWKVEENLSEGELINKCNQVIRGLESEIPVCEKRITKRQFMHAFGFIGSPVGLITSHI